MNNTDKFFGKSLSIQQLEERQELTVTLASEAVKDDVYHECYKCGRPVPCE